MINLKDIHVVPLNYKPVTWDELRRIKNGEYGIVCSPDADLRRPLDSYKASPELIDEYRLLEKRLTYDEYRAIVEFFKRECVVCGEDYLEALDFHHRDPLDKLFCISEFYTLQRVKVPYGGLNAEALFDEIDKCDVLCATCHRKVTFPHRRKYPNDKLYYKS